MMMMQRTLPLIEIGGKPLKRGQQQGEGARSEILRALARYREVIPKALNSRRASFCLTQKKSFPSS